MSLAVDSGSIGNDVPAEAPAPNGDTSMRLRAPANRTASRTDIQA